MTEKKYYLPQAEKTFDLEADASGKPCKRILILEDQVEFAEQLKVYLESHGYSVTMVANGVEGLKQIMALEFEVILCDMVMPTLPGDMFYLAVERSRPKLCKRFIFMTGHRADPKWDSFVRRIKGIMLWKPFTMADLMAAIQVVTAKAKNAEAPKV